MNKTPRTFLSNSKHAHLNMYIGIIMLSSVVFLISFSSHSKVEWPINLIYPFYFFIVILDIAVTVSSSDVITYYIKSYYWRILTISIRDSVSILIYFLLLSILNTEFFTIYGTLSFGIPKIIKFIFADIISRQKYLEER